MRNIVVKILIHDFLVSVYAGICVGYKDLGVQLLGWSVAVNLVYLKLLDFPNAVVSLYPHRSSIWEFPLLHVFANMGTYIYLF